MQGQFTKRMYIRFSGIFAMTIAAAVAAQPALALGTVGTVMDNSVTSVEQIPGLFSGLSYLFGIVLGAFGIAKLYEHVQNPNQTPIWDSLKRFVAGGAFFALPMVLEAAYRTLVGGGVGVSDMTGFSGSTSGTGLDAMVVALMADIWTPVQHVLGGFAYLAGIILVMVGISRLLKSAQEGPRGPGGLGTIMTFITAGALFSLNGMLGTWSSSLFGTNVTTTIAELQYTGGMTGAEVNHVHAVISALIAFVAVLGWISFIRGWFIMRDVAEGSHQASLMAGITHLFGGALAVNLGPVLNAVQTTLGLNAYGVNFN